MSITSKGPAGVLDPEVDAFLGSFNRQLNENPKIDFKDIDLNDLRSGPSVTEPFDLKSEPVEVENKTFLNRDGIRIHVRIYRVCKEEAASPLVFFHGGCWVFCDLDSHDSICRKICYETKRTVISVAYRLAPENKFPSGLNDCYDAANWVHQNRKDLHLNQKGLVLCGDSAGGNLAASVSILASRSKDFPVHAQILFYPITDISNNQRTSYQKFNENYFFTQETIEVCGDYYTKSDQEKEIDLVSPLLADDVTGLPKTLIQTAEFDILRDEAELYAKKLLEAGIDVDCVRYNGLIHAYLAFAGGFERGKDALLDAIEYINKLT